LRTELRSVALEAQSNLIAERGLLVEAQVLEILAELMVTIDRPVVPVAEITDRTCRVVSHHHKNREGRARPHQ
jgi:hypothetical protein